jgi:hypothetical protein
VPIGLSSEGISGVVTVRGSWRVRSSRFRRMVFDGVFEPAPADGVVFDAASGL